MTDAEKLDEAQWLLDGGVIPENVALQLGTTAVAVPGCDGHVSVVL